MMRGVIFCIVLLGCGTTNEGAKTASAAPPDSVPTVSAKQGKSVPVVSAGAADSQTKLTAEMVSPHFTGTPLADASEKFSNKQWGAAAESFGQNLKKVSDPALKVRGKFMEGLSLSYDGQYSKAAPILAQSAKDLPHIADYLNYHGARAYYFARQGSEAEALASKVSKDSFIWPDAHLLRGDIARGQGDTSAVIALYEQYLKADQRLRLSEARYRLAQAYESKDQSRAVELYRKIYFSDPLSSWAELAQEKLDKLAKQRPKPTADELIERGMVYFNAMRNPLSEADFAAARQAKGINDKKECVAAYHHASSIFKQRNRSKSAPVFDEALALCKKAGNKDLAVKSAYQAGRSYAYNDYHDKAIKRFKEAEVIDKTHTYRDDARLRQAEVWADKNKPAKVKKLLSSIPDAFPTGDMRAEAMWRVGWMAYKKKKYDEAIKWWKKQIKTKPRDDNYWAEGQPQYWIGRALQNKGNDKKALDWYVKAVETYPMTYYAMLALNRIRETDEKRFAEIEQAIKKPQTKPPFSFVGMSRPTFDKPGFERAVEFMRLGLFIPAEAEFRQLGMKPPPGRNAITDPGKRADVWAMAYLYNQIGSYPSSHWVTRWHVVDYKEHWPVGGWRAHWEIAYPKAYFDLMGEFAKLRGFPKEMMQAIMREESAFDPKRESYANAVGLTQMIYVTARRFSKGTPVDVTRKNFRSQMQDPRNNVTVGSNFLGFLFRKWDNRIILIPPSYNAGEGAVGRWLRARGHLPADEWLEEVGVDQPRRYTKRVLSSFFAYSYLYSGKIPVVRNSIPKKFAK